ncbi:MAG: hypothetical protein GY950_08385 [bacterium]|nr:hypothetical protein [bacterium]
MVKRIFQIYAVLLLFVYLPFGGYAQEWEKMTGKEKPTFAEVRDTLNKYYNTLKDGRKPGFKQFKRWEWFARQRLDRSGYLSPALNWKGWMEKNERFRSPARTAPAAWSPLGPVQVPANMGGPAGLGRLNCVAFDPQNPDILWVGAPTGGLWKTTDGGQTWSTLTDSLPNIGVSAVVIHPTNRDIMYIATGDKERGSTLSSGIMKSTDGGLNWDFTGLNPMAQEKCKISRMHMLPGDPETILASSNKGIYKTVNGGQTWEVKETGDFYDIEVSPADPTTWYASRSAAGVYRSYDSGETWTRLTNGLPAPGPGIGRIVIAVSRSAPSILYAVYSQDRAGEGWIWGLYGAYRSSDGGNTWPLQARYPNLLGWDVQGNDTGGQGGFAFVLEINPTDPDTVFVGSVNLWRSTNGGVNWGIVARSVHVDYHDLAFRPGTEPVLYSCTDGGFYKSENNGANWTDLSSGLAIQQVYRLGLSRQDPNMLVVGAQDNGSEIMVNNQWRSVYGGDGTGCLIDYNDSSTIYCSWQFGHLVRSTNGGGTFGDVFFRDGAAWITPFVMHPGDSNTLYAGVSGVYKTTNRGSNWNAISGELSAFPLTVLAVAPSNPDHIWCSDGTRLFKTVNGGTDWIELNRALFPAGVIITHLAIHPRDPEKVWLTFGGYGRWNSTFTWENMAYIVDKPKVFHTTGGGVTWTDVSGLLPNIPANCIVVDAPSLDVYVGTDLGVFHSAAGVGEWKRFDNGLPNVIITDMEIHEAAGKIVAATYGRGVWESPLAVSSGVLRLYPPLRFSAVTEANKSLLQTEYINVLTWENNPVNTANNVNVVRYRLYVVSGDSRLHLADVEAGSAAVNYEYSHRGLGLETYRYALSAVDDKGNESNVLYLTVRVM